MIVKGQAFRYRPTGDSQERIVRVTGRRRNMKSLRGLAVYRCVILVVDAEGKELGVQRIPLEVGEENLLQREPQYDR